MIKFKQKVFDIPDPTMSMMMPTKYGPGMAVFDAASAVIGNQQNKKALESGKESLRQNEVDFKKQMKQNELEHQAQMQQLDQQAKQYTFSRVTQKMFIAPLVGMAATMIPGTIVSGVQGKKANQIAQEQGEAQMMQNAKFQKKQMEQQDRFQKEQMKMQEKIAKMQANAVRKAPSMVNQPIPMPEPGSQGLFSETDQREFGVAGYIKGVADRLANSNTWKSIANTNTYRNARGLVSDVGLIAKKRDWGQHAANSIAMGGLMAGTGYVVDKAITADAKKNGILPEKTNNIPDVEEEKKQGSLKRKIGIGAGAIGTVGTTLVLARKGKLNTGILKNFGNKLKTGFKNQFYKGPATAEQIAKAEGDLAERTGLGRKIAERRLNKMKSGKGHVAWGNIGLNTGFAAIPVIGYLGQKKAAKQQQEETQRSYAVPGGSNAIFGGKVNFWRKLRGGARGLADFVSFGAGRTGQKSLGREMFKMTNSYNGPGKVQGSGSKWTENIANLFKNDVYRKKDGTVSKFGTAVKKVGKTAGGLVVGGSVMMVPWVIGESGTKKAIKALDKDSFAYERTQNQQVQQ